MKNRLETYEDAFATWGANNYDTLVEMFEDFQSEFPDSDDKTIESFALFIYEHDQSLVDSWERIKEIREEQRLLKLN